LQPNIVCVPTVAPCPIAFATWVVARIDRRRCQNSIKAHYRLMLAEQGFVIVYQKLANFSAEPT